MPLTRARLAQNHEIPRRMRIRRLNNLPQQHERRTGQLVFFLRSHSDCRHHLSQRRTFQDGSHFTEWMRAKEIDGFRVKASLESGEGKGDCTWSGQGGAA